MLIPYGMILNNFSSIIVLFVTVIVTFLTILTHRNCKFNGYKKTCLQYYKSFSNVYDYISDILDVSLTFKRRQDDLDRSFYDMIFTPHENKTIRTICNTITRKGSIYFEDMERI